MNKAVIGVFPDNVSASRAVNDLKANGFEGETINQLLREDVTRGQRLPGPRIMPAMELLKGLIIGAIAGAAMGAIADWFFGMRLTWPNFGFERTVWAAIFTFAAVGAIAGILEGLAAAGPLAAARSALQARHRGDAVVSVHTDETHSNRAADLLRAAGAFDVRRGASSVTEEFRTYETVQPEPYGVTPVVARETVTTPADAAASRPVTGEINPRPLTEPARHDHPIEPEGPIVG